MADVQDVTGPIDLESYTLGIDQTLALGAPVALVVELLPRLRSAICAQATALAAANAQIAALTSERDEARRAAGLGCEAANGGPHSIVKQGGYQFCQACGYTITAPKMTERVRKAEARANALEAEVGRLLSALRKIADLRYSEAAEPDPDAWEIADAALSQPPATPSAQPRHGN